MNDATKKYVETLENLVTALQNGNKILWSTVDELKKLADIQDELSDLKDKRIVALENDNSYLQKDLEAYKAEDELAIIEANKILDANFARAVFPNQA